MVFIGDNPFNLLIEIVSVNILCFILWISSKDNAKVGQGDLAIFVMGGSGRVEIMVKINYSDTAGQYKEGKSGESVKYGSGSESTHKIVEKKHLHKPCDYLY